MMSGTASHPNNLRSRPSPRKGEDIPLEESPVVWAPRFSRRTPAGTANNRALLGNAPGHGTQDGAAVHLHAPGNLPDSANSRSTIPKVISTALRGLQLLMNTLGLCFGVAPDPSPGLPMPDYGLVPVHGEDPCTFDQADQDIVPVHGEEDPCSFDRADLVLRGLMMCDLPDKEQYTRDAAEVGLQILDLLPRGSTEAQTLALEIELSVSMIYTLLPCIPDATEETESLLFLYLDVLFRTREMLRECLRPEASQVVKWRVKVRDAWSKLWNANSRERFAFSTLSMTGARDTGSDLSTFCVWRTALQNILTGVLPSSKYGRDAANLGLQLLRLLPRIGTEAKSLALEIEKSVVLIYVFLECITEVPEETENLLFLYFDTLIRTREKILEVRAAAFSDIDELDLKDCHSRVCNALDTLRRHADDKMDQRADFALARLAAYLIPLQTEATTWPTVQALTRLCIGFNLYKQYEHTANRTQLTSAIKYLTEAHRVLPSGHSLRPTVLVSLASKLQERCDNDLNISDITTAIAYGREALGFHRPDDPNRASLLASVGRSYTMRYDLIGDPANISEALKFYHEALKALPPGSSEGYRVLHGLAVVLRLRYLQTGEPADLDDAITFMRDACTSLPVGLSHAPYLLNTMASLLQLRYRREDRVADLSAAIALYNEALGPLPPDAPERPMCLNNLADALYLRHRREKEPHDINDAVAACREAIKLLPPYHPRRFPFLNNIGMMLQTRYELEGRPDDIAEGIASLYDACGLLPSGSPDRCRGVRNIGLAHMKRYRRGGKVKDLLTAVTQFRKALSLWPVGHPWRAVILYDLAVGIRELLKSIDLENGHWVLRALTNEMLHMLREAALDTTCSPRDCFRASIFWLEVCSEFDPPSTISAYETALRHLDVILASSQSLEERHDRLVSDDLLSGIQYSGVVAASSAIRCGQLKHAVEVLEQGRSLLLAQLGRYRVELDRLRQADSALADRFANLSRLLNDAALSEEGSLGQKKGTSSQDAVARYRKISTDWKDAVKQIQALDEFKNFLKPPSFNELLKAAAEGPVIIVISMLESSDALIIQERAPIRHIELRDADITNLVGLANEFTRAVRSDPPAAERRSKKALKALWDVVVGPIAKVLETELAVPLGSRVWWYPTGVSMFLPLHAAGQYSNTASHTAFPDLYVSSYIPTLQALLRARRTSSPCATPKLLIVSQPNTPPTAPLPSAAVEADAVTEVVAPVAAVKLLSGEDGTCAAAQDGMITHSWIHLICHGVQVSKQPLDSFLLLHDGPLTFRTIIKRNLPNAEFAFLSACHSAAGDTALSDEVLHMAAAMHFVGFKGVVGTMWAMVDDDGPPLAKAFYHELLAIGDCRGAAVALSKAAKHLRDIGVPANRWMRFVHYGI